MDVRVNWKNLAESFGVIAIVISLVFVGFQLQQTQAIALSEVLSANTGHRVETNNAIVENADVWSKANDGQELTAEEALIIDRLIDNITTQRISLFHHFYELGEEEQALGVLADFAEFLHKYPGIYEIWLTSNLRTSAAITAQQGRESGLTFLVEEIRSRVDTIRAGLEKTQPAHSESE